MNANKIPRWVYPVAAAALIFAGWSLGSPSVPGFDYEVLAKDPAQAVVLLKDDSLSKEQLGHVADSLYYNSLCKPGDNFKVMYYYRRDYRDHICYASKAWLYDGSKYNVEWDLSRFKSEDR